MTPSSPPAHARMAALLGALAMFGAFSIDTVFPAFPAMAEHFGVGKLAMQQTISVYMLAYAGMSLFHGAISDAIGRKPVILGGVAVFAVSSVGCALASDFSLLLLFRAVQGLSAGVGLIIGRAVVRDLYQDEMAQRLMSQISMIFGLAPAVAPVVGGWIVAVAPWQGIFWFLALFGVAVWVAVALWLPETHPPAERTRLHPIGFLRGNLGMLGNPTYMRLAFAATLNFSALFLYISSAPAFVLDLLGLNAQQFGWFFIPTISGMMLGAYFSGRLAGRVDGSRLAAIGFVVCGLAVAMNLGYNLLAAAPRAPWAVLPLMVNAFGVALVFPVLSLAMLDMYPRRRGAASSMHAFISLGFNAVVAGLISAWVSYAALPLAATAAVLSALAFLLWRGVGR